MLLFSFIIILLAAKVNSEDTCKKLLRELGDKQSKFLYCTTTNAVPVTLCLGCEEPYTEMVLAYNSLRNEANCTAKYFDKDRINIVQTTENILEGLWAKAFCSDCFTGNNSLVFDEKDQILYDCLHDPYNKGRECMSCLLKYEDLNNFYINMDSQHKGYICYDVQDKMNRTRALWSDQYKCCQRIVDLELFTIAVCLILCLPIFFYSGVYVLAKRQERNHDVLINTDTEASSTNAINNDLNPITASSSNENNFRSQIDIQQSSRETEINSDSDDSQYNIKKRC